MPNTFAKAGLLRSEDTKSVRNPAWAITIPKFVTTLVLPSRGLELVTRIVFLAAVTLRLYGYYGMLRQQKSGAD